MRSSELKAKPERPESSANGNRNGNVHDGPRARAAGAEAYWQLSGPMIELVEAGLITVSDSRGDLPRDCAISVLADPESWDSSPSSTIPEASSLARLRQSRTQP
jgi:hypothetical protein